MCIALGHLQAAMAHPLHDRSYVYTCAQQSGTAGVTQHMHHKLAVITDTYGVPHFDEHAIKLAV